MLRLRLRGGICHTYLHLNTFHCVTVICSLKQLNFYSFVCMSCVQYVCGCMAKADPNINFSLQFSALLCVCVYVFVLVCLFAYCFILFCFFEPGSFKPQTSLVGCAGGWLECSRIHLSLALPWPTMLACLRVAGAMNWSPHACVAGTLSTKSSP